MGKAGNASTGLWPCCSYPETDVTLNPSLGGEKDVYDCKKHTNKMDSMSAFVLVNIHNEAEE